MRYHVTGRAIALAVLGIVSLIAVSVLMVGTRSGFIATADATGAGCRSFWGETVIAGSWSRDGDLLGVLTSGSEGLSTVRVFGWPGMALLSQTAVDVGDGDSVAITEDGTIFWSVWDPFSNAPLASTLWRRAISGEPEVVGTFRPNQYFAFFWADGALVGWEPDPGPPERSRLARLSLANPAAAAVGVTPWTTRGSDFWIDRTGAWTTWTESDGPGEMQEVVVRHGDREQRFVLPGYGGRVPTLTPARDAVIYQRSETARLTLLDLQTGNLRGEIAEQEFYGGEVSSLGILAAPTAHGPFEPNELCVLDVSDRLTRPQGSSLRVHLCFKGSSRPAARWPLERPA